MEYEYVDQSAVKSVLRKLFRLNSSDLRKNILKEWSSSDLELMYEKRFPQLHKAMDRVLWCPCVILDKSMNSSDINKRTALTLIAYAKFLYLSEDRSDLSDWINNDFPYTLRVLSKKEIWRLSKNSDAIQVFDRSQGRTTPIGLVSTYQPWSLKK